MNTSTHSTRRRLISGAFLVWALLCLLMVWGRAQYGAYANYERGVALQSERAYVRAITYYDRALHWYTPFSPFVERSARQLWSIGEMAEGQGDVALALLAYRSIRRGFYAARSFYQPGGAWIQRSEEKVRELMGQEGGEVAGGIPARAASKDPEAFWSLLAVLFWVGWLASVAGFIMAQWGPWQEARTWLGRRAWWGTGFALFFALWLAAMTWA